MWKNARTYRLIALAALLLAGLVGFDMYQRAADRELWGYRPLLLYFFTWLGATGMLGVPSRNLLLSSLSGLLFGLGFPGYLPLPFLLFFAWVPLLIVHRNAEGWKLMLGYGFNAFVVFNFVATYWVTNTAFFAGLFAVLVNAALMCLPWLLYEWTSRRAPGVAFLSLAAGWVAFEYGHYNWSLNWPWLTLGNGFAQFPAVVQWYEWTGVLGGSVWVLVVNWLVFRWLLRPFPRPFPYSAMVAIIIPVALGLGRYLTYTEPPGETISVAAIQPNFEPHFEKFTAGPNAALDTFLQLSQQATAAGPIDYLIFPETSFGRIEEDRPLDNRTFNRLITGLSQLPARYLISGYDGYYRFKPDDELTDAVRYIPGRDGQQIALEALNGAIQVDLQTRDFQTYRKGVFVPGAESFPFRKTLFFLEPLVNSLGGTVAGRGTQATRDPLTSDLASIAPVICYESVFGEYFTGYVRAGAQAAFVVTNDGWWDNTAGHRQHNWIASLRAIETRRAIVRSANVGNTSFIDQRGNVVAQTPYGRIGFLRGEVRLNDETTFYVRFRDWIARIALLLTGMVLLTNVARTFRK